MESLYKGLSIDVLFSAITYWVYELWCI